MKFLMSEQKTLVAALESAGLTNDDYSFVKRKGRVHVQIEGKEDFTFFRRKLANLANNQFEKSHSYEVAMHGHVIPVNSWEEVLEVFRAWLKK